MYSEISSSLRDVDVGVLVADEVNVGDWKVLAGELSPRVASLVVPLELAVLHLFCVIVALWRTRIQQTLIIKEDNHGIGRCCSRVVQGDSGGRVPWLG